jgi:hypothetical protein
LPVFFGVEAAKRILEEFGHPSLIIANNVAAHVPDIIDFFSGISILCDDKTIVSIENPSLGNLLSKNFYDTIYHEHFSYLSIKSVDKLSKSLDLSLFSAEELQTHGGSIRYWLSKNTKKPTDDSVNNMAQIEFERGVGNQDVLRFFADNVQSEMGRLSDWVDSQELHSLFGYGAAAKTVTTFFAAKLSENRFRTIIDANSLKQGCRLPGTSVPIQGLDSLSSDEPDKVLVFPWNLEKEIVRDLRKLNPSLEIWVLNPLRLSEF